MKQTGRLILSIASIALSGAAHAADVRITGDDPRNTIAISAENSRVNEILQSLAGKYGFKIKGIEHVGAAETITTDLSGSLPEVLARLLRNRNHMIVRSPDNTSGIESVMILNANYGAGSSKFVPRGPDQDFMQQFAGAAD